MTSIFATRAGVTVDFAWLACGYWGQVFPLARYELRNWRALAEAIPDAELRRHALETHRAKGTHSEGAAAFAVLAPLRDRRMVVRALTAFQALYDYLDTLSEQPGSDPLANGWRLHGALIAAVDPDEPIRDFYALHPQGDDGGYVGTLIAACRRACCSLAGFPAVADQVRAAAVRAMESQGYHHALTLRDPPLAPALVERWAAGRRAGDATFYWWETLGAAGSSLAILALLAVAARPSLRRADADAIACLYYPWGGALLGLMDSLADQVGDTAGGQHSLTGRYRTRAEASERLRVVAARSIELARGVPDGRRHALIIAAMACFFATEPHAVVDDARTGSRAALTALGDVALLPLLVLRLRRRLERRRRVDA